MQLPHHPSCPSTFKLTSHSTSFCLSSYQDPSPRLVRTKRRRPPTHLKQRPSQPHLDQGKHIPTLNILYRPNLPRCSSKSAPSPGRKSSSTSRVLTRSQKSRNSSKKRRVFRPPSSVSFTAGSKWSTTRRRTTTAWRAGQRFTWFWRFAGVYEVWDVSDVIREFGLVRGWEWMK